MYLTQGFLSLTCWTLTLWSVIQAIDHVTSSSWRLLASQRLDAFQAVTRGRSKMECIRECQKYSHCNSFVFNVSSHTCYLLSALNNVTDREHLEDKVYINMGKVMCYDDFINITDDVSVQYLADGSWQREGMCLRHVWRNPPLSWFPINLPYPVTGEWSVCMDGIPTLETRFTVELVAGPEDRALHADFRFRFETQIRLFELAYKKGGYFTGMKRFTSFPFVVGQSFYLRITATVSGLFELYVNNSLLASQSQHPDLPATAIKSVFILNDVNVTFLDLWCRF